MQRILLREGTRSQVELLATLTSSEVHEYKNRSSLKRAEWLLGRVAAKEAIRQSIEKEFGEKIDQKEIVIKQTDLGAPYFETAHRDRPQTLHLSISHATPYALALVSRKPVGGDVEQIRTFTPALFRSYSRESEIQWVETHSIDSRDMLMTVLWSLKESVLKALGVGLRVHPQKVYVVPDGKSEGRALCYYGPEGVFVGEWSRLSTTHLMTTVIKQSSDYA